MNPGIACIGYGGRFDMGKIHLENATVAGFRPLAVCAPRAAERARAEEHFPGIRTFDTADAMLSACPEATVVSIVVPTGLHGRFVAQCLSAGRHVVVEKPAVVTMAEFDDLAAQAAGAGLVFTAHHNRLFDGRYRKAREMIDAGAIGRPVRAHLTMGEHADPAPDYDKVYKRTMAGVGGRIYDWGSHLAIWGLALLGDEPAEVSGFAVRGVWSSDLADIEDELTAVVRTHRGGLVTLRHSQIDGGSDPWFCTVTGTHGTIRFGWAEWELLRPGCEPERGANPPDAWDGFYRELFAHLAGPTGARPSLTASTHVARMAVQVCELATRSAQLGRALMA